MGPVKNPESNAGSSLYRIGECRDCDALNAALLARIKLLSQDEIVRRHHYLGGRYENIYLKLESVPELRVILDLATAQAAHLLSRPKQHLRLGWWLNIMQPGDITYPHTHDEGDELLSGVYYIEAPPRSGRLLLMQDAQRAEIEPQAGRFVYFAPDVIHEVTRNESGHPRISIGFNLGPAQA
ncbi:hypothetical protein SCL_0541 [Sulfuricaulis limicola]|uniref:Prolyl 4-hydroxylase alpha subunit Fe(2+) 2OG dioxygenase domain-containing protein n=1 Tax=Sulfuricaulis limicola TaxID=1620215 RepID=A0A1B4XDH3_9GAMM|nr:2OG-Fe(II) oxygenase [Sulfuricaulis limicola]BAV32863.1 hypothetical protein SCL_0541 [Sulfuricaulis limicola]